MRDALRCAGAETMLKRFAILLALISVLGFVGNDIGLAADRTLLGSVRLEHPS